MGGGQISCVIFGGRGITKFKNPPLKIYKENGVVLKRDISLVTWKFLSISETIIRGK